MLKKSCAIILSIALAMGILVHGSFAFGSWGSSDTLWTTLIGNNSSIETITDYISSSGYEYMFIVTRGNTVSFNDNTIVVLSNKPLMNAQAGGFGLCSYDADVKFRYYTIKSDGSIYSYNDVNSYYRDTNWDVHLFWYLNSTNVWWLQGSGTGYASYDFLQMYGNSAYPWNPTSHSANLIGLPWQDNRVMNVYIDDGILYSPYLAISVDDMPYAYMWISVRYTDEFGSGTEIFDIYDLDYYPGDDFQLYLINPLDISYNEFTVTSVVYSGSLDWGYKEVDDLNLVFNEPVYPDPIPSVTPVPDYNYFDTDIINYNGGQKDIFYNSFQVYIQRYEGLNSSEFYFKDREGYLIQPFAFNYILLPYYPVQQGFVYDEFVDDCFYQYDVILSEYYDAYFDFFYGSGALTSLQYVLQNSAPGDDISSILERWYANHDPIVFTFPFDGDPDGVLNKVGVDMPALMVITDSFYFKQTNYLLGDTGDILSQFSERFYKVDGFADTLFGNLLSSYNLDLTFYNRAGSALTSLSYWLNENSLSKLDYLVNIDNDLHALLEWFQNQDDPDVVLALPYFNPSMLTDLYGLNIGDLIQFFNGFVSVLPSFDYSDFPNFFTYANGVVDDVAGNNDSILDDILDPYEYDDSGLSTFGWD